ncbi:bacteriophage-type DNA polymerase [Neoasaia chiangmaiensis NBRC 101099]|uniref:Uncharacterized protein n=1 Tax=Neoasaia chiangmaiensis TaxID=320497 RepID=A0A1U9KM74_9PROT|nr:uracil-DNA glycosylase [Neoasaia chiangmaiensis]AQS86830.1 hypothetical protein A0U93_01430 [Neoasaia chiangmaiensis]GBR37330.1 bacteriophage-type DNA polymerase [Neoasaia chiangmaiensis NBRC 101099]GEN14900.1 uracil-DNA glycosylase [Neoasaia chiangmaiensis]
MSPVTQPIPDSEILALLHLYRDWGVDCTLSEEAVNRFDSLPAPAQQPHESRPRASVGKTPASSSASVGLSIETAPDFKTLEHAASQLPDCILARMATHYVGPVHVPGAQLMLIGEVPDADEDRSGNIFAGATGILLDRMLASINLDRTGMSQTPALPWRPPGGRDITPIELKLCRPILERTIALCAPKHLVVLGTTPTRMLLGETTQLARVRGRWATTTIRGLGEIRLLPMRHPSQIRASATARRDAWRDLLTLADTV